MIPSVYLASRKRVSTGLTTFVELLVGLTPVPGRGTGGVSALTFSKRHQTKEGHSWKLSYGNLTGFGQLEGISPLIQKASWLLKVLCSLEVVWDSFRLFQNWRRKTSGQESTVQYSCFDLYPSRQQWPGEPSQTQNDRFLCFLYCF